MSKKNFGLAAQLVRPRVQQEQEKKKSPAPVKSEPPKSTKVPSLPKAPDPVDRVELQVPQRVISAPMPAIVEEEALTDRFPVSAPSGTFGSSQLTKHQVRQTGRPRRPGGIKRINLVLSEELHDYAMAAWRTYRKKSGEFANGPSGFIEDLVRRHRDAEHGDV